MRDGLNRKSFLKSAQSRVILAIGLVVVAVVFIIYLVHLHNKAELNVAGASLSGAPGLTSLPGAGNPSDAYVAAQNKANAQGEEQARKDATAFVPTLTRSGFVGNPDDFGQMNQSPADGTTPKTCGINKVVVMYKPRPDGCDVSKLALARQSGVTAEELVCQGCACPALKTAGYNAGDLRRIGMTAEQLKTCGFSLQDLVAAGFSAADLKDAGYTASELKTAGFSAGELKDAGFSAADLKAAGYSASQLKSAGFSAAALKDAGFDNAALAAAGFSPAEISGDLAVKCSVAKLQQERAAGMTAAQLKAEGCDLAALKAAGFTAGQLKAAGFSASELKDAGFSDAALAAAGFSPAEIQKANRDASTCNIEKLKKERLAGVSATALRDQGCGLAALKAAGFSAADLRAAGFTAAQLKAAGFSAKDLKDAGFSAAQLKAAGFTAAQLKDAGYNAADLKAAGFSAGELKDAGFSAADLRNAGFTANQLKNAGFSAAALKNAGFSAADLKNAGFSASQLAAAGYSAKDLKDAGFSAAALHAAGLSASELKDAGFNADQLKAAGFTAGDLARAGFASQTPAAPASTQAAQPVAATTSAPVLPAGQSLPAIGSTPQEAQLAELEKQQQAEMSAQQQRDQVQRQMAYMMSQAGKLMSGWSNVSTQSFMGNAPKVAGADTDTNGVASAKGGLGTKNAGAQNALDAGGPIIKAGSVLFGVLDTSVNSDEKTPIMARVVSGPLIGAKLLGTFTRQQDNVLIQFTLLSSAQYEKSIPINVVAIDPATARTAISGQVNNHYLLRYGSLFASSFVQGIAEGIINQGTTSNCLVGNFGCTLQQQPLDWQNKLLAGLGQVGQAYSQHLSQNYTLPPTIRISAGTGVGLLLMSDLQLPLQTTATSASATSNSTGENL